jgi:factor associated with neutral sphingomyelinase activation
MDWRGEVLATGSWDSTVKIWHCSEANGYKVRLDKDLMAELESTSQVTCLNLSPDNSRLVTGTRDGAVTLWCLNSNRIIQELPSHKRQVNKVQFSPDGARVVSCGSDFYLKVIDLKSGSIVFSKGDQLSFQY